MMGMLPVKAQTTYLPLNHPDYHLMDRLEILSGRVNDQLHLGLRPASRKDMVRFLEQTDSAANAGSGIKLSKIDEYNMAQAISESGEWVADESEVIQSKHPILKTIYKTPTDFLRVNTPEFFAVLNPIIGYEQSWQNNYSGDPIFINRRGAEARGLILKRIGFYTMVTDNQERMPTYADQWKDAHQAVPGMGRYNPFKSNGVDYMDARGYIDVAAIKDHLDVTFGYDKQFVGDGYRSLFLSDFSNSALFLKLNLRVWKLNYQITDMELMPQFIKGDDEVLPRKYMAMHHLSMNVTKWLNVGLWEGVVMRRQDHFDYMYLVPIIFLRAAERNVNSPDNAMVGFNFKANVARHFSFYGQLLFDELRMSELTGGKGWYGNKWGIQLGGKYINAFGLKNLDLQGEVNMVRPYTYSHYREQGDTFPVSNYTHYNQPMAHPVGAGFVEALGIVRYQPLKNLYITAKAGMYRQGIDSGSTNYGSNIFLDYGTATSQYGVSMINGIEANCMYANLRASYELRPNLFIDLGVTQRNYSVPSIPSMNNNTTLLSGGVRLNIQPRQYDF